MKTLYIEKDIKNCKNLETITSRFANKRILYVNKYADVFNRKKQDFRFQKKQGPAFIFAKKRENFVLPIPGNYASPAQENFYFSHLYNCPFDCEYCFLQGLYTSANFVLFVNFEDYKDAIEEVIEKNVGKSMMFFSGYDCDSLALEKISGFAESFVPWIGQFDENIKMEFRTKSANIEVFTKLPVNTNTVIAWTISPEEVVKQWEPGTASLQARVKALATLQKLGWKTAIRMEPLLYFAGWKESYERLFEYLEKHISFEKLYDLHFGQFRLPKDIYKRMRKRLPESTILTKSFEIKAGGEVTYSQKKETEMKNFMFSHLKKFLPEEKVFYYQSEI